MAAPINRECYSSSQPHILTFTITPLLLILIYNKIPEDYKKRKLHQRTSSNPITNSTSSQLKQQHQIYDFVFDETFERIAGSARKNPVASSIHATVISNNNKTCLYH
uniref:Uncharacterized protein n=1 Tax=Glossina pallidipes TaxID=7398 RepID=A0A1A9ZST3_GLOPL